MHATAFSPDGTRLAIGGDKTVQIWDATTGQQQVQLSHKDAVRAAAFSSNGTRPATGASFDTTVRIWDIGGG